MLPSGVVAEWLSRKTRNLVPSGASVRIWPTSGEKFFFFCVWGVLFAVLQLLSWFPTQDLLIVVWVFCFCLLLFTFFIAHKHMVVTCDGWGWVCDVGGGLLGRGLGISLFVFFRAW